MSNPTQRTAVIVGGNRVPFARAGRDYAAASNQDLMLAALNGLAARHGLAGERLGEVVGGAVLKHAHDFNLTREAVLGSALDPHTPACDLQQACATGLESVVYIANKIRLGQLDNGIGAGVDSASDVPMAVGEGLRRALLKLNSARTLGAKMAAMSSIRPGGLAPEPPKVVEARTGLSMGEHQALTTKALGITREAQDELALASHHNMARAWDTGFFDDLVTGFRGVTRDQGVRGDTSMEKLSKLPVVFGKGADGTMTAGNSTGMFDGASTVLLGEESWANDRHLPKLAKVVDAEVAAVDFTTGAEGLLMAPVRAIPRLLQRNDIRWQDFDRYEIHEAFAATVLCTLTALNDPEYCQQSLGLDDALGDIDRSKLNVNGSSLAAGHPFAATGGRIAASLAKMLHELGPGSRGLISVCAAGGQGIVAILEGM